MKILASILIDDLDEARPILLVILAIVTYALILNGAYADGTCWMPEPGVMRCSWMP